GRARDDGGAGPRRDADHRRGVADPAQRADHGDGAALDGGRAAGRAGRAGHGPAPGRRRGLVQLPGGAGRACGPPAVGRHDGGPRERAGRDADPRGGRPRGARRSGRRAGSVRPGAGAPAGQRGAGVPDRDGARQAAPADRGADPLPALPASTRAGEDRGGGRCVRAAGGRGPGGLLALALGGCAGLFGSFDVAPSGLRTRDDRLRRMLEGGRADAALEQLVPEGKADPGDALLRALYAGTVAHYAGEYEASSAAFELAVLLAEDRYTTSISRSALSLLTSDRALPFEPSPSERLLIPYYSALNYLNRGDTEGAAVEARRLSALLERYRTDERADRRLHGLLRAFAGAVFEAAGERNDADVAYRNARALGVDSMLAPTRDVPSAPDSLGDVVVLIERGFVAHRVEQGLAVLLLPEEIELFDEGNAEERAALAAHIAARVVAYAAESLTYTGRRPATLFVAPPADYTPPRP